MATPPAPESQQDPLFPTPFTISTFQQISNSTTPSQHRDYVYIVRPQSIWQSLTRYQQFQWKGISYRVNDRIHLTCPPNPHPPTQTITTLSRNRIAHILDIRAHSPHHVYLRVFWFHHPAHLLPADNNDKDDTCRDSAAAAAKNEVIATNDMAIVDASWITGPATVVHHIDDGDDDDDDDDDDDNDPPKPGAGKGGGEGEGEVWFWRRKWDMQKGFVSCLLLFLLLIFFFFFILAGERLRGEGGWVGRRAALLTYEMSSDVKSGDGGGGERDLDLNWYRLGGPDRAGLLTQARRE